MTEVAKIYLWHKTINWFVVLGLLVFSLPTGTLAQEITNGLVITADRLEMDEKRATATFSGAVIAHEGEMVLYADRMEVNYYKKDKASKVSDGGVEQVMAFGNVILEQSANKGSADKAEYIVGQRKLTLIGESKIASIVHSGDKLSGKRILLIIGRDGSIDKVSVLGGGNKRVSASIMPSNSKQKVEKIKKQTDKKVSVQKSSQPAVDGGRKSVQLPVATDPELKAKNRVSKSLPQLKQLYDGSSPDSPSDRNTPLTPPKLRVD
ncbi:MAG: hypothetical protein HQL68_08335 [Magnetococcales bacterium]|nr:hypothetical protein [Magnetococcales bacterium]